MSQELLAARQEEAILRLRKRNLGHLEDRLPDMFSARLANRFHPRHLLAVGALGALFIATDEADLESLVVVKMPLFDWARPGKISVSRLQQLRQALRKEALVLQQAAGDVMPALIDCFTGHNPLVVEPQPRVAPDERFVVMEWIEGDTVDVVARTMARQYGPDRVEFARWVAHTMRVIIGALQELRRKVPAGDYYDIAPRNFLMPGRDTIRVVDAGGFAFVEDSPELVPFTAEYCPLTDEERRSLAGEQVVARRLALLGLDLLTDKISRRIRWRTVVGQLAGGPCGKLAELLAEVVESPGATLADLSKALRDQ